MSDFLESLKGEEPKLKLEKLLPGAAEIQEYLGEEGIESLIGGGVGVDLLALKYFKDTSARTHGDVDLYIPISKRGVALRKLESIGAKVDIYSYTNSVHGIVRFKGVRYDVFSIDGNRENAFVHNPSAVGILMEIRHEVRISSLDNDKPISMEPDLVEWNGRTLRVMDVESQLSITSGLRLLTNKRDMEILKRLSSKSLK